MVDHAKRPNKNLLVPSLLICLPLLGRKQIKRKRDATPVNRSKLKNQRGCRRVFPQKSCWPREYSHLRRLRYL